MKKLQNKAVVITGAGRGIGAACARSAAAEGAAIVVNDVDREEAERTAAEIVASGGRAVAQVGDISLSEEANRLIERCVTEFGAIDGLVNNAAMNARKCLVELDEKVLRRALEVNVAGVAFCSSAAARHMLKRGRGSIVNILSGAQCGIGTLGVYGATKGAVASFTYSWAIELEGTGVRVNGFAPTKTETRMIQNGVTYRGGPSATDVALPPEVNAPPINYLLSDEAADINGQILRFDGKRVTIMAHPAIVLPYVDVPNGDFDGIAEAFRSDIAKRQMPLGIVGLKVEFAKSQKLN